MTGLKSKNGASQRDKLKMGIGKNERRGKREWEIECLRDGATGRK